MRSRRSRAINRSPFQISHHKTFCLALDACIRMRNRPRCGRTIVLQLAMFYWRILALTTVVQQDPVAAILGNSKPHRIASPLSRQFRASAGIAQVTEFSQLSLGRNARLSRRSTGATKSSAQRQSPRKWPVNFRALFAGKKIRTSHDSHLSSDSSACGRFFSYD